MKHSFAATNPCHVYPMALALWELEGLECYYSGYPRWRLRPPAGFPIVQSTFRTLLTYGMQRLPERLRPKDDGVFRWQDRGFDAEISARLAGSGFIHGLPGQCRDLFRKARSLGMVPILNHASGPLKEQRALVATEYARVGKDMAADQPLPSHYQQRLEQEVELAEIHCAASSIVREQLMRAGINGDKIWIVPYGADFAAFPKRDRPPTGSFKVCFAGRQSLRKGIYYILKALELADSDGWEFHCIGMPFRETQADFDNYKGAARIFRLGTLPQAEVARIFQQMDVLVLPSAEEAFGLVVVQALACGVPCIVSDRVGARDLIREGENGSVFPFGDSTALAKALTHWSARRITVPDRYPWSDCARSLLQQAAAWEHTRSANARC